MCVLCLIDFFFFKQKTAYEMRISDWSSDVCSSDLNGIVGQEKISGTDSARDDKPFGFGGPDQVKALPRRHVAEVDGCLCLACQHDVAGNRNRFGARSRKSVV